jgi:hypothetical protein
MTGQPGQDIEDRIGQSGEVDLTDKLGQVNLDRTERTRWPV